MSNTQLILECRQQLEDLLGSFTIDAPPLSSDPQQTLDQLNTAIDHTLLKSGATPSDIEGLCKEAKENNFASVCVYPSWVKDAKTHLQNTGVKVCTVVGFPHGNTPTDNKIYETQNAIADGATEIDMVIPIGALKSMDFKAVFKDIESVVKAATPHLVKVIIETSALALREKIQACLLAQRAKAHFVKTSTGFGEHGATLADVKLMAEVVEGTMGIKASGGIRTLEAAKNMVLAGATRLGTSASVDIVSSLS